ncbi:MAG: methyltransferase [Spirochaetaceae bacterium]|nr:methyltransferase [Spirochaetaceae bacterium]
MSSARRSAHEPPEHDAPWLRDYLHKSVSFRFAGHTLQFALSQSLFSSFDVDTGSRLLLTSVAQQLAEEPEERGRLRSILDLGCGTGVLGVALAKHYAADLTARDRDALALAVSAHNAARNGVACRTAGGVDTRNLDGSREGGPFRLVVSNLPAKAGAPVLAHMIAEAARVTGGGGRIALVVVSNLAAQTRRQLAEVAELIHEREGHRHTVFHARPRTDRAIASAAPGAPCGALPAPYRRRRAEMTLAGTSYPLETAYGLPDFDRPSHLSELAATTMQRRLLATRATGAGAGAGAGAERILTWNTGQGHLPVWLAHALAAAPTGNAGRCRHFTLVSRDALQLLATRANLCRHGIPEDAVAIYHQVALHQAAGNHDLALLHPDDDLPATARDGLFSAVVPLVSPGGNVVLYGGAPDIAPLLGRRRPFTLVREARRRALRVAILGAPNDVT